MQIWTFQHFFKSDKVFQDEGVDLKLFSQLQLILIESHIFTMFAREKYHTLNLTIIQVIQVSREIKMGRFLFRFRNETENERFECLQSEKPSQKGQQFFFSSF